MFSFNRTTTNCTRGGISAMIALTAIMAVGGFAESAKADLLAYWNFNDEPAVLICSPSTGPCSENAYPLQANVGSGHIDFSGWGGGARIASGIGGGTTLNGLFGDPAGSTFRLDAGPSPFPGNFTHIDFKVSMADRENLSMSFALRPQWSPAFGTHTFNIHVWSWSTDGINFTEAGGYEITEFGGAGFWYVQHINFFSSIAELNGAEDVTLRLMLAGSDSNQATSFDNIQIHANVIPAPGALALLGLAGLFGARRRRLI